MKMNSAETSIRYEAMRDVKGVGWAKFHFERKLGEYRDLLPQ